MEIVFKIAIICTLSAFISILIPGFLINFIKNKIQNRPQFTSIEDGIWIIASGFLFNFLVYLALLFLLNLGFQNQTALVIASYGLDFLILAAILIFFRTSLVSAYQRFWEFLKQPLHLLMFIVVSIFGFAGIANFPHTLDCGQLKWTLDMMNSKTLSLGGSMGALGYSALIYFPGVLFKSIPLATLAAGFKILLGWLFVFGIIYLAEKMHFAKKNAFKIILFFLVMSSSFVTSGIYELGKDSILAVLFSVFYIACLFEEKEDTSLYIRSGLLLFCSIICGIITIPYLLLLTSIYFIFNLNKFRAPFLRAFYLLVACSLGLMLARTAIIKISLIYLGVGFLSIAVVLFLLRNINFSQLKLKHSLFLIFPIFLGILFVAFYFLMPIKLPIIAWYDANLNPIQVFYAPLDGSTSFLKYLNFSENMNAIFLVLGVLGMFAFSFDRRYRQERLFYAMSLWPFLVLLVVIAMVHMKNPILSAFNLWDISKDITKYYYPYIFAIFGYLFIEMLTQLKFFKNYFERLPVAIFSGFVIILASISILKHFSIKHTVYTEVGGDRNKVFAYMVETLTKTQLNSSQLYLDKASSGYPFIYSYQMFGTFSTSSVDFSDPQWKQSLSSSKPYLIAINNKNYVKLESLFKSREKKLNLVKKYTGTDTSLFEVL